MTGSPLRIKFDLRCPIGAGIATRLKAQVSPGISIVVPVYGSAPMLPTLVGRLEQTLSATGRHFEVILVNDGSRDNSWEVIKGLASQYPWLRGLDMMRNFGQHSALLAGIRSARFDVIATLDNDLQHPPEELPKLLATLDETVDLVYGRPATGRHGLFRRHGIDHHQVWVGGVARSQKLPVWCLPSACFGTSLPGCVRLL